MEKQTVHFILNGKPVTVDVTLEQLLIDLLRDDLGLTGTKKGCGVGECGACTVIIDGKTVNSCLVLAATVDGCKVETIEGLSDGKTLHRLQQAFIDHGAVQCGFCTPGMLLSAKALFDVKPQPSRREIETALSGNICRCTGYKKIVDAVQAAARVKEGQG